MTPAIKPARLEDCHPVATAQTLARVQMRNSGVTEWDMWAHDHGVVSLYRFRLWGNPERLTQ